MNFIIIMSAGTVLDTATVKRARDKHCLSLSERIKDQLQRGAVNMPFANREIWLRGVVRLYSSTRDADDSCLRENSIALMSAAKSSQCR